MTNTRSLALLVVFVCVFAILGTACWGSVLGFSSSYQEPAQRTLSVQANVTFTRMLNENLQRLNPNICDAGCYAKKALDTYIRYRTGVQR